MPVTAGSAAVCFSWDFGIASVLTSDCTDTKCGVWVISESIIPDSEPLAGTQLTTMWAVRGTTLIMQSLPRIIPLTLHAAKKQLLIQALH